MMIFEQNYWQSDLLLNAGHMRRYFAKKTKKDNKDKQQKEKEQIRDEFQEVDIDDIK